ncbi:HdeD family acid-resistance protein [Leifsonia sp. YAF41]|uniref:HdeD family acid-resistance protein n=1 Tax=Leifsonia sp. YAF41 TaxID=3233086 RepID=UPI003F9A3370
MSTQSGSALGGYSFTSGDLTKSAVNGIRIALGVGGVVTLLIGLLITFQPQAAAATIAILLGIYFIVAGLVYVGIGIFARGISGGARALDIILGVLFLIGAGLAFGNLSGTVEFLAVFLGIAIGILWIIEGVATLVQLGDAPSKTWAVILAIVSIIAGIALLFAPLWGAQLLFLLTGIALIVIGVVQIIRAFTFGRGITTTA